MRTNTRRMHQLRTDFYIEGQRLDSIGDERANCWICKQSIDYTVPASTTSDSHELDHYYPVATHPELQEDPDNFRHSHSSCNGARGKGTPTQGLGNTVPAWW